MHYEILLLNRDSDSSTINPQTEFEDFSDIPRITDKYISIEKRDGKPYALMILNQDGNFSEYGEDSIELINAVSKMPSTMRIITGIRMNDYYALSPNNTTLIALTEEARKVLDGETGTVAKLRTVQKKDWEDYKNNPPAPDAIWDENGWLSPNGELYITGEPPADLGAAAETADLSNGHASIGINLPTWVIAVISISALTLIIGIVAFGKLKTSIIRNE